MRHAWIFLCLAILFWTPRTEAGEPVMDRLYRDRVEIETSRWLSVRLFNAKVDAASLQAEQFSIQSDTDAELKSARPLRVGSRTRAVRVAERTDLLVKETAIFLELPAAMKNGQSYRVQAQGIEGVSSLPAVTFDDQAYDSGVIRINQLGYRLDLPKIAYVGQYMGSAGPMPIEATAFELIDENKQVAFSGKLTHRAVNEQLAGQQVWEADFSTMSKPGAYRLRVAGIGLSPAFVIGERAMNPAFVNLMRGHWHQRCGAEVPDSVSRFTRVACHLDDAFIDPAAEKLKFVDPKNGPLYPTVNAGQQKAVHGHHDAGDYGKYTMTGVTYIHTILTAYAAFPGKFDQDNLNLPSSGNGIPDLLEECKWELDWLEQMQDADGGVFGVIRPRNGGYENSMPPAEAKRFFFPKDTAFTAGYAAALANASRSDAIRKYYPEDAKRYLARALKAWEWAEQHPRFVQYFHYGAVFEDRDERAWAAMELYAATGEQRFHDRFLKADVTEKKWGWQPLFESLGNAILSYVLLPEDRTDPAMRQRCLNELVGACDTFVADSAANPYRLSMPKETIRHGKFGWLFPGDSFGFPLLIAHKLTGEARYREAAWHNLSYTCGANAQGYFLQTGLGTKRNIEVVDNDSSHDDIIEPVSGIPLGVGSADFYWLNRYQKRIGEGTFPPPNAWPLMHRWYDGFNVSTEFTMGPMARETVVAGYFASASLARENSARPKVSITADTVRGNAPLAVQFGLKTEPGGAPIRETFWDFDDESFSTSASPVHTFDSPGRMYRVTATVIDENGQQAWSQQIVNVSAKTAAAIEGSWRPIATFPFEQSLASKSDQAIAFEAKAGNVEREPLKFVPGAAGWRAERSKEAAGALRMRGLEQIRLPLARVLREVKAGEPLAVECQVYLRSFAGWGWNGNPLLFGIEQTREQVVGLRQLTWERQNKPMLINGEDILAPIAAVSPHLPADQWLRLRLELDAAGRVTMTVNGQPLANPVPAKLDANRMAEASIVLGPIDGYISGLEIQRGPAASRRP